MQNQLNEASLTGLFRELSGEVKTLIKKETELAKSEMSEKLALYSRNAVALAMGGAVAYAGLIVLLGGVGLLLGWAFQTLGWDAAVANFVGLGIVGIVAAMIGGGLAMKALTTFKNVSLAPEKSIEALQELPMGAPAPVSWNEAHESAPPRPAEEVKPEVAAAGRRIGRTLSALAHRASPAGVRERVIRHVRMHPLRWGAIALSSGICATLLMWPHRRKA